MQPQFLQNTAVQERLSPVKHDTDISYFKLLKINKNKTNTN